MGAAAARCCAQGAVVSAVDPYCYLDAYWEACQAFVWLHFWERFGRLVIRREAVINTDIT